MRRTFTTLLLLVVTGCTGGGLSDQSPGSIVVSTSILGDLVANIVGDELSVEVLMPPGTDPHDFQPSARQASLVREAALVVVAGLGLEEGLIDLIEDAEAEGANVLELATEVDPIELGEHAEEELEEEEVAESDDHGHGDFDPHFWQDPLRMAQAVQVIAARLQEVERVDGETIRRQAEAYAGQVEDLHAEIEALVETLPPEARRLVTNHDAFGYFANRYGFEIVGVVIPGGSTLAEPSSSALASLVGAIEEQGVKAIFAENVDSAEVAETLAVEVGHQVAVVELYSDSLGGPGSTGDTYLHMMMANARAIVDALR